MSETFYVCRECAVGKTVEWLRSYRPVVECVGDVTTWHCPECGARILLAIDGGKVDLGLPPTTPR